MIERWLFKAEEDNDLLRLFLEIFLITILLSFLNILLGGNFLFLVSLTALTMAYPLTKYIRHQDHLELTVAASTKSMVARFDKQVVVCWCIFLAVTLAFAVTFPLIKDASFQEGFVNSISGAVTQESIGFSKILFNNLNVAVLTGLIALISTSGLIFVLFWNASILVYVLSKAASAIDSSWLFVSLLGHGLLEIGGYVFIGLAASLLSYRFERYRRFSKDVDKVLMKNVALLLILSFAFILAGAIVEIL